MGQASLEIVQGQADLLQTRTVPNKHLCVIHLYIPGHCLSTTLPIKLHWASAIQWTYLSKGDEELLNKSICKDKVYNSRL